MSERELRRCSTLFICCFANRGLWLIPALAFFSECYLLYLEGCLVNNSPAQPGSPSFFLSHSWSALSDLPWEPHLSFKLPSLHFDCRSVQKVNYLHFIMVVEMNLQSLLSPRVSFSVTSRIFCPTQTHESFFVPFSLCQVKLIGCFNELEPQHDNASECNDRRTLFFRPWHSPTTSTLVKTYI